MENLYRKHAREYLQKKYPKYKLGFWSGELKRVNSLFHAKMTGHHIVGEIHILPLTSPRAMSQAATRIERLIKDRKIEDKNVTKLIFAPRSYAPARVRQGVLARIHKKQEAFKEKTGIQIKLMPNRRIIGERIKKLKEHARKQKITK